MNENFQALKAELEAQRAMIEANLRQSKSGISRGFQLNQWMAQPRYVSHATGLS